MAVGVVATLAIATADSPPGPPFTVLLYHLEKTGGTTVRSWLRALDRTRRLRFVSYAHAHCYLHLFEGVFKLQRWQRVPHCSSLARYQSGGDADWTRTPLAVEFHDSLKPPFTRSVLPNLAALRAVYAQRNVSLLVVTTVREPMSHLLSTYRMWPSCRCFLERKYAFATPVLCELMHRKRPGCLSPQSSELPIRPFAEFALGARGIQA